MEWATSPIVSLISLVIGIGGVIWGIVSYYKSKRDKDPQWSIQTVNLFNNYSSTVAGMEVKYLGQDVENLSISKVAFWNKGALTIQGIEIADADPLRLESTRSGRILSAKIVAKNNLASNPLLSRSHDQKHVYINFDYLDRWQGFVFQVVHEGISSADLLLTGSIKGAPKVNKVNQDMLMSDKRKVRTRLILNSISTFLSSIIFAIFTYKAGKQGSYIIMGISGFMIILGGILLYFFVTQSSIWSRKLPSGLETFYAGPQPNDTLP